MEKLDVTAIAAEIKSVYDDGTFIIVELGDAMVEIERADVANPEDVTVEELAQLIADYY
ncbi:MAG: hypothetical protein ACRC6H_06535 [Culicoidibacterales bacterium]